MAAFAVLLAVLGVGCASSHPGEAPIVVRIPPRPPSPWDVLLVLDSAATMAEEHAVLAGEVERLARILASGDWNDDGVMEFVPPDEVRLGVITGDLGSPLPMAGCTSCGDDGVLRATDGCGAGGSRFLRFEIGDPVEPFAEAAACLARVGTGGCAIRQPLEAALRALSPAGHGQGSNAGFLQDGSQLIVVVVSDRDDCSVADPALVDPADGRFEGSVDVRCAAHPEALHELDRYVEGLVALRASNADLLSFVVVGGMPSELTTNPEAISFQAILDHPAMQPRVDGDRLLPACVGPAGVEAAPARRLIELAGRLARLGPNARAQSICALDLPRVVGSTLLAGGGFELLRACLPERLPVDERGAVACEVTELLPARGPVTRCEQVASTGREPVPVRIEIDDEGRAHEVCRLCQVRPLGSGAEPTEAEPVDATGPCAEAEHGWYYAESDDGWERLCADSPAWITFTGGGYPIDRAEVTVECVRP